MDGAIKRSASDAGPPQKRKKAPAEDEEDDIGSDSDEFYDRTAAAKKKPKLAIASSQGATLELVPDASAGCKALTRAVPLSALLCPRCSCSFCKSICTSMRRQL